MRSMMMGAALAAVVGCGGWTTRAEAAPYFVDISITGSNGLDATFHAFRSPSPTNLIGSGSVAGNGTNYWFSLIDPHYDNQAGAIAITKVGNDYELNLSFGGNYGIPGPFTHPQQDGVPGSGFGFVNIDVTTGLDIGNQSFFTLSASDLTSVEASYFQSEADLTGFSVGSQLYYDFNISQISVDIEPVPLPTSFAAFGAALVVLGSARFFNGKRRQPRPS